MGAPTGIMEAGKLPADVRKQKEEAERLLAAYEQGGSGGLEAALDAVQTTDAGAPAGGPAASMPADAATLRKQVDDLTKALSDLQAAMVDENNGTWKHKYQVMNGKYNAETAPALRRVSELEREVERLRAGGGYGGYEDRGEWRPPAAEVVDVSDFDRNTADKWGVAPEDLAAYRQSITDSVISTLAPDQGKTVEHGRVAYNTLLDAKVRGWRQAVNDPAFVAWLKANPGQYAELQAADQRMDADAVAEVYGAYFRSALPGRPSRESASSSAKGSSFQGEVPEFWTMERIAAFENEVATGKIKMGSPEYKKLKASRDEYLGGLKVRLA